MAFTIPNFVSPATGAPVGYLVIETITLNIVSSAIAVLINGFVDQQAFISKLQPTFSKSFFIQGVTYDAFLAALSSADLPAGSPQSGILLELIGALQQNMLTLPFFENATIVA